ncbi:hypothetical protein KFE25_000051 [Diacronema lutheri]|uniref:C2 domain-containing protein n=2 Tax=Diacronema lutheri TaxID=2081491 RepID=A0A8J6CDT9_DIALT|nr:hypothetical protein KFE25_000051 [Diacronema lutheri]
MKALVGDALSVESKRPLHFDVWMRIVKARNLPAKGLIGLTDAFARVLWGHRTTATPTSGEATPMICFRTNIRKRSLNPRWDFERAFAYRAAAESLSEQQLVVQVFHHSPLLGDELIGSVRLSLYEVATAPMLFDLPLLDAYAKPAGRISLNIRMQQLCALAISLPTVQLELSRSVGLDGKFYTSVEVHGSNEALPVSRARRSATSARPAGAASVGPAEFHREMTRRRGAHGRSLWDAGEFEESSTAELVLSTSASNFAADSLHIRIWCVREPNAAALAAAGADGVASAASGSGAGGAAGGRARASSSCAVHNPMMLGECWLPFAKVYTAALGMSAQVSVSAFSEPLWSLGQRSGMVGGSIRIRNGPQLKQLDFGFLTERGVVPASPMVLSNSEPEWPLSPGMWNEPPVVHAHCVSSLPRLPSQLVPSRSPTESVQLPPEARQLHMLAQALMKALLDEATSAKAAQQAHQLQLLRAARQTSAAELALRAPSHASGAAARAAAAAAANVALAHSFEAHMPAEHVLDGYELAAAGADARPPSPMPASASHASAAAVGLGAPAARAGGAGGGGAGGCGGGGGGCRACGGGAGGSPAGTRRLVRNWSMPKQLAQHSAPGAVGAAGGGPGVALGRPRLAGGAAGVSRPIRSSSADALTEKESSEPSPVPRKVWVFLTRITQLLHKSHKKSAISYVYRDQGTLLWTQQLLLKLWAYLLQHVDSVAFALQPLHFQIIVQIMTRGELDVGGCVECGNVHGHSTSYAEFVTWYRRVLLDTLHYVIRTLNRWAVSQERRLFCAQVLAIAYFRLPEFRKHLLAAILPDDDGGADGGGGGGRADSAAGGAGGSRRSAHEWYGGLSALGTSARSSSVSSSPGSSRPHSPATPRERAADADAALRRAAADGGASGARRVGGGAGPGVSPRERERERKGSVPPDCPDAVPDRPDSPFDGAPWPDPSLLPVGGAMLEAAAAAVADADADWSAEDTCDDARAATDARDGGGCGGGGGGGGGAALCSIGDVDRADDACGWADSPPGARSEAGAAGGAEAECTMPPLAAHSRSFSSSASASVLPVEWGGTEYWARLWDSISELPEQAAQRKAREAWLEQDGYWRQRLSKRGHCFCTFVLQWVALVRRMGPLCGHATPAGAQGSAEGQRENVPWAQLPGYDTIVRAFFVEMRRRAVTQWPESMQQAALALLANERLIGPLVSITLRKMTVHRTASVASSLDMVSSWLFALHERSVPLPSSFDFELLLARLRTLLCADHFKILTWTIIFLHNHLHLLSEEARSTLLMWLSGEGHFERLLLHWCHHVRAVFLHLLVFKVIKRGQHTIGYFPPSGEGIVPIMLASLYARRIEQVQQQHVEIQRVALLSAESRRARGGAPAAGARFAPPSPRLGSPTEERPSGACGAAAAVTNPTLCYAICAFKQLAELMAKFDQFNEEGKEGEVDRTESRFLPMKVLRDELPDDRLFDGGSDDW